MEAPRKLPIGIQDFEDLRQNAYVYVDKTKHVYNLVTKGKPYFLSRPRRFGKSLLVSTLEAYFLGKKELFKGLWIYDEEEKSENPWQVYPVLKFSLASGEFTEPNGLRNKLNDILKDFEEKYSLPFDETDLVSRFKNALKNAYEKTGKKVVVLVDEYDTPLLRNIGENEEQEKANRALYKGFFATLKDYDAYLRFVFFTGVTKFSKVSVFSDLNQLQDITLDSIFSSICGITQAELESNFAPEIEAMAEKFGMTKDSCLAELKKRYDGYHFTQEKEDVYNPFSLINAFAKQRFGNYWFETGTPTFLVKKLNEINFDMRNFEDKVKISEDEIKDYRPENDNPIPLLYQSGYLTIKGFNAKQNSYKLGFPNEEVRYGFLKALAPIYLKIEKQSSHFNVDILDDAVEEGYTDGMRDWFTSLFAILPYPASGDTESLTEQNFQNVIYLSLLILGKYVRTEVHSAKGRADCIIETDDFVYVFEFKRDVSAKEALKQIDEQGYAKPYEADKRKLFKIGVNFSTKERNIVEWEVVS
ncbi:MAG: ATP-binding protein [Treponema sp.]|uniref:ATP-binding protein n=1 Tax=Treponema sp. TaxID=166 RepID=UPI0025F14300|nr:ATP-binding protein [Treponema sp.]MBQ9282934.1 ATP-binding protein [Treponema sp.]